MIIPISTQELKIGDKVVTIKDFYDEYYIITIGHEFEIVDYNKAYDRFICEDINKLRIEFSKSYITKKVSLKTAKKEFILNKETAEYKGFILKKCPNKTEEYWDRDIYNACKLKISLCNNDCVPILECAKYLKKDDINKSIVLSKYLRLNKLNKLKDVHVKGITE